MVVMSGLPGDVIITLGFIFPLLSKESVTEILFYVVFKKPA